MENNNKVKVVKTNFFKKIWYAITKFERYPEMAAEGTGKAFSYLIKLMLIFSIIVVAGLIYNFRNTIKQEIKYINENIDEINYQDGKLSVKPKDADNVKIETEVGTIIIATDIKKSEGIDEYEKQIQKNNLGILWLNNKVVIYTDGIQEEFYYGDLMQILNISKLEKSDIINYLQNSRVYLIYGIIMFLVTFILYFITTLIDILVLSVFGLLTAYIAKIRIRYRAMFNMSVYALTISIILKMIYILFNMFINFEIKYFDIMYSSIGYICLAASIFMIKSDVIKQQIELIKIMNEKKQEENEEKEEDTQDTEKKEEKEEDKKEDEKNKEPSVNDDTENQGSEA